MASRFYHVMAALSVLVAVTSGLSGFGEIRAATSTSSSSLILFNAAGQAVSAKTGEVNPFYPIPSNFPMTAATCRLMTMFPACIFYSPDKIYYGAQPVTPANLSTFSYPDMFPDFVWGGLDAVAVTFGDDYYFKGCDYLVRNAYGHFSNTPGNVGQLGIPCNVDAAWGDPTGTAVVLKGDQVWRVGNDINAPQDFDEYVLQTYG